jgi:hypothetical protein
MYAIGSPGNSALPGCMTILRLGSRALDASHRGSYRKDALRLLSLNSVMIGTQQLTALATFYEKVIGKPADMVDSDLGFYGWQAGSAFFSVLEHSAMGGNAKDPGRVMFNFETAQVNEEFERVRYPIATARGLWSHSEHAWT